MPKPLRLPFALALLALAAPIAPALAASGYDACTDFVSALPATISTPGTWCLTQDLATSMSSGAAIILDSDDVTLDCNGFRIDDAGGGTGTTAIGILATNRRNLSVRRCEVRTFRIGLYLGQAADGVSDGHLVEDNLLNINRQQGLYVYGDGSVVRRNRVLKTGLSVAGLDQAFGISTQRSVDVLDNVVSVVEGNSDIGDVYGIDVQDNANGSVRGNRVRGVHMNGAGHAHGVRIHSADGISRVVVRNNVLSGNGIAGDAGLECASGLGGGIATVRAKGNSIIGFDTPLAGCANDGNTLRQ
jgi:hypothetical protein